MPAILIEFRIDDDVADVLHVMGELHRLYEQAIYQGDAMARYGIDLDEAQVKTAGLIADHYGLTIQETIEHMILMALQEAVMGITRPGLSPNDVHRALQDHSERLVREMKARRGGGLLGR